MAELEKVSAGIGAETSSAKSGRNPLMILAGFALLGAALAVLLFGAGLFGGGGTSAPGGGQAAVLDQVSELQFPEPVEADGLAGEERTGALDVGERAYSFTLDDLDGNPVSLADFRGRPVIINFWATWCAPCRIEMPELQAAYEKYQDDSLAILALDQDEPPEIARAYFYDEMNLTFTPLLDEDSVIATSFGSFGILPTSYFLDPEGVVTAIHRGPMTLSQIDGYLAETIPTKS